MSWQDIVKTSTLKGNIKNNLNSTLNKYNSNKEELEKFMGEENYEKIRKVFESTMEILK